jgi:hypothetical protein
MGDKVSLLSGKGQSQLKLSGNGNECKPLLLGKAIRKRNPLLAVAKLGAVVLATFAMIWAPFAIADGQGVKGLVAGAHTRPLFSST